MREPASVVREASIRPRLLARGDDVGVPIVFAYGAALQFGHACLRVETIGMYSMRVDFRRRFNSATPACAWRRVETRGATAWRDCFNSATPACAWRPVDAARFRQRKRTLQFGHACLRVETFPVNGS